jgi:hypothetical protein
MTASPSHGMTLWQDLLQHLKACEEGPETDNQTRSVLWGITAQGNFVGGMTADRALHRARKVLVESGRVYRWQDTLCFEIHAADHQQLLLLASRPKAESGASALLANLLCVGVQKQEASSQSLPPGKFVNAVLADQQLWQELPCICHYARRPVCDANFNLCGPGWHPEQGILVHGPDVTPATSAPNVEPGTRALDRLPPRTQELFQEFCFRSDADLANALALLLTGFLVNHFVDDPHPVGIIDGNQRGLGKTLLIQAFGRVLDGVEPPRIPLVGDEELEKKLCAHLREARSTIIFFDNVRNRIESALLEGNALSPLLCFRILGQSATISRPNAFLWVVTSNLTAGTEDFINRGLPIRLYHEGDPKKRHFSGSPLEYATSHRLEILGELAGMVQRWRQQGMPLGAKKHRCGRWSQVLGGILAVSHLDEFFLANVAEAEESMDEGLQALATLAEHVVTRSKPGFFLTAQASVAKTEVKLPREWVPVFEVAEVFQEQLAGKNPKGRDTWVGTFLAGKTDRTVRINLSTSSAQATLRKLAVRRDQKRYYFEIVPDEEGTDKGALPADGTETGSNPLPEPTGPTSQPTVEADVPLYAPAQPAAGSGGPEPSGNNLEWV